ncbi:MAG: phage tail sheath family protein [Anaerolineales bacterium]
MPEYLAPGVYVEEIDSGSKPIEGVSTSTAGMIGVTERGPVNVPILITSTGEYTRWFGGHLNIRDFSNGPNDPHCYLPHGVEGFFTNSGKRVYITRVLDTGLASRATFLLFNRGEPPFGSTVLLRAARENTGTAVNPPLLVVLSGTNLAQNDWIRTGDGSDAEYRQIAAALTNEDVLVPLNFPLSRSHIATGPIDVKQFAPSAAPGAIFMLANPSQRGDAFIEISGTTANISALEVDMLLEIGANVNIAEHRFIRQIIPLSATNVRVRLDSPLTMPYPAGEGMVRRLTLGAGPPTAQVDPSARAGESLLFVNARGGNFDTRTDLIVIDPANIADREVRRIGELHQMTITPGAAEAHAAGAFVEGITLTDGTALTLTAASIDGATTITVSDVSTLRIGQRLLVGPAAGPMEKVDIQSVDTTTGVVTLALPGLATAKAVGDLVITLSLTDDSNAETNTITVSDVATLAPGQTLLVGPIVGPMETVVIQSINLATRVVTLTANLASVKDVDELVIPVRALTAAATTGASFIALNNRIGLQVGDILRIGAPPNEEYVTITGLPNRAPAGVGPDAGNVVLASPLVLSYSIANTPVVRQNPPAMADVQPTVIVLTVQAGEQALLLSDGADYDAVNFVRLTTPTGTFFYRVVTVSDALTEATGPQVVTLNAALSSSHPVGSPVVERRPLLLVQALDAGAWGNRLRISADDEPAGLVARTILSNVGLPTQIQLGSLAGVEAGTLLELLDPTSSAPVGGLLKVRTVNRATGEITLDGAGLNAAQQAAHAAAIGAGTNVGVRSREFSLTLRLYRQPDPQMPSRNNTVLDSETFRYLSMDVRHSRYVQTVIGDINGPLRLSDRRSEGESWYIRVHDTAQDLPEPARTTTLESARLGPETLVDILPDGRTSAARHRLSGGDDSIATLTDSTYVGVDDPTPESRTGLHSLRNIEEISIVACPGRTSVQIQNALINQCELMRYRFAVLDGPRPPNDTLTDVQNQRQQFDTKYAALYHPWLLIPDPYPTSPARVAEYPIPPSGHMLGVYARTDIERGVHKAPANEVVRGILGLQRLLNKEQHDILNPYPVNINVIRDFRDNNRGIRVFGGRVITSDSDWKYVNVRRLLIFIEASIDRGLQWVVFEPNAEPLWARVRRSISNFLTLVWRNGGLEGTKVEEAYFVKCDRTTMTQTDIDSGRLIVIIGVAPVKPAEFVIVRIGLWTAHAED